MNNILVTGGLGYIGSHTVVELQKAGYQVVVVDNLANTTMDVKDRIIQITGQDFQFYELDVCDTAALTDAMKTHQVEGVIHFAADKAVGESVQNPSKYYLNNLGGLASVLQAVENLGLPHLVFSSSCTVYGETDQSPITEEHPLVEAISPYGTTKLMGEQMLRDFVMHKDARVVALRYFNPVGAHETGLIGELPKGVPSNLIPYVTQTAAGIRQELTVHGGDYATKDGTCIRDYIHVADLAAAHVLALDFASKQEERYEVFNLGTGQGSTVLEVIKTFEEVNDLKLNYRIGPRRDGDIEQIWAATQRSEKVLGWKAKYDLKTMMRSAWVWQQTLKSS